jgi:hypothetical protein
MNMKKYLIIAVLVLLTGVTGAQAQLKFGLKAGVNLANASLKGDVLDNLKSENLTGFQVGPMLEFQIPIIGIGIDAAALYSQEGFKLVNDNLTETFKLNTIEVPVNLKYKLSIVNLLGVYAAVGPYAAFNLSNNLKEQAKSRSFGAGMNFGLGVELLKHLQVGVNYRLGMTDDFSEIQLDNLGNYADLKAKTKTWSVTATYLF